IPLGSADEFFFLDEVHIYSKWNREIKVLHDQELPSHFVVSGSASSIVLRDAAVTLAGRSIEHTILPLTLSEILEEKATAATWDELHQVRTSLSKFFITTFEGRKADLLSVKSLASKISAHGSLLRAELARYLRRGGFPEPVLKNLTDEEADARLQALLD